MKAHQLLLISVMLIAAIGAPVVMADSADLTTYMINFTGTGILPTAGQFTYDPDAPNFTDFTVVWNGYTYDLTSSANGPGLLPMPFSSLLPTCVSSLTGAQATFALMSGACTPPANGYTPGWSDVLNFPAIGTSQFGFIDAKFIVIGGSFGVAGIDVTESIPYPPGGTFFTVGGSGSWTISPIPEPTSLLLLGTGLGPIGLAAWRRRK